MTTSREAMYEGDYNIEYVPLNDWDGTMGWDTFMEGAYEITQAQEIRMSESRVWMWARRVQGDRVQICEPPLPELPDSTGRMVARPHGAVLHFEQRPPQFVNTEALRTYLEFRGVTLKREHPREEATMQAHPASLDPELRAVTYTYRGVMEILQEMLCSNRDAQPMTQEEYEQMGIADPIPWEYTSPTEMMLADNFNQAGDPHEPSPAHHHYHHFTPLICTFTPGPRGVSCFQ